jgi:hypothetical protein
MVNITLSGLIKMNLLPVYKELKTNSVSLFPTLTGSRETFIMIRKTEGYKICNLNRKVYLMDSRIK